MEKIKELIEKVNDELSDREVQIHFKRNGNYLCCVYYENDGDVCIWKDGVKEEDLYKTIEGLYDYLRNS